MNENPVKKALANWVLIVGALAIVSVLVGTQVAPRWQHWREQANKKEVFWNRFDEFRHGVVGPGGAYLSTSDRGELLKQRIAAIELYTLAEAFPMKKREEIRSAILEFLAESSNIERSFSLIEGSVDSLTAQRVSRGSAKLCAKLDDLR